MVRHLTSNQVTRVRFPAEHIFTHFLCFNFCSQHTPLINICQKSLCITFPRKSFGDPKVNEAVSCWYFPTQTYAINSYLGEIYCELLINLSIVRIWHYINLFIIIVTWSKLQKMCDSPQSFQYKGPSNSAEWRGWFSGLVVRHLTGNQETQVRFLAEHIFPHFLCCFDFCSYYTLTIYKRNCARFSVKMTWR